MKDKIDVSIIVPVYNVEKFLVKCVNVLCNQTLKQIEIILVDDGSTDDSGRICDELAKKDERIKVIHKLNGGLGLARNSGLKIAKGEYIGFVDSDDIVSENMFYELYSNAKKYSADISYCLWKRFSDEKSIENENVENNSCKIWKGKKQIKQYLLDRIGLAPNEKSDKIYGANVWSGIFKRKIINENNIIFESERKFIAEDIIFDIDIIPCCCTIVHSDAYLYFYRYNPTSLTGTYKKDRFEKNIILYAEMKKRLLKNYSEEEIFNSLARYFITFTRVAIMQEVNYLKHHGYFYAKGAIKRICNEKTLRQILAIYEYNKLPFKYRFFCLGEKYRLYNVLLICSYLHIKGNKK